MRLKSIFPVLVLMAVLSACGHEPPALDPSDCGHPSFVSAIKKEECCLCGERTDNLLSCDWGQDNVGLANVNTFDVCPIDIN